MLCHHKEINIICKKEYVFLVKFKFYSKNLFKRFKLDIHICADGTYKLIWQKHSLLVAKSFHPDVLTKEYMLSLTYLFVDSSALL